MTTLCLSQMLAVMHSHVVCELTEDGEEEETLPFSYCFGVLSVEGYLYENGLKGGGTLAETGKHKGETD